MKITLQDVVNGVTLLLSLERAYFYIPGRKIMDNKNAALLALLDLMLDSVGVVVAAETDGKITVEDAGLLLKLVPDLGPAFAGVGAIPAELKAMSAEDEAAVVAHVMAKLVVGDAHARGVIEASLKAAAAMYELVKAIKAPVAAPVLNEAPAAPSA